MGIRSHLSSFVSGMAGVAVGGMLLGGISYAANGGSLVLGHANTETMTTTLSDSAGSPLALNAKSDYPPLRVGTKVKVPNLNADLLDGVDSSQFLRSTGTASNAARLAGLTAAQAEVGATALGGSSAAAILHALACDTPPHNGAVITFTVASGYACDLSHIVWPGASLFQANLARDAMDGASLTDADLTSADLHGAYLGFANLNGAFLGFANLSGASLQSATLIGANIGYGNFTNVAFDSANLTADITTGAIITGATFNNTICPDGVNSDYNLGTCVGHGS